MRIEVLLPKWGMTMHEGTISEWAKAPGDRVSEGEIIARVETEKAVGEIQAPATGTLAEIVVAEEETVDVGSVIAYITAD